VGPLLPLKCVGTTLQAQNVVPIGREKFMLPMQFRQGQVMPLDEVAGPLLNGHVVVTPVVRVEGELASDGLRQLEAHSPGRA
jgi:hypothetical protein